MKYKEWLDHTRHMKFMRDQVFLMSYRIVVHCKKYWKQAHGITRNSWEHSHVLNKNTGKTEIQYAPIVDYTKFPLRKLMVEKYIKTSFKFLARTSD